MSGCLSIVTDVLVRPVKTKAKKDNLNEIKEKNKAT